MIIWILLSCFIIREIWSFSIPRKQGDSYISSETAVIETHTHLPNGVILGKA